MAVRARSTPTAAHAGSGIEAVVRRHPVPTYFLLTFALSSGAVLVVAGPGGLPATPEHRWAIGMAMLAGPSIAGLLMTAIVSGRAGLRDLLAHVRTWRVGWRWYALALLTAPLLTAAVTLALSLLSTEFAPVIDTSGGLAALLLMVLTAGLLVGVCEELGWTGFAIPHLLARHGILATGLTVGVLWGAWHVLMFWEADSFSGALPLTLLLVRLFAWLPAYRVLMVWAYDRNRSLLLAILMHASATATSLSVAPPATVFASLISIVTYAAALWTLALVVTVVRPRRT